MQQPDCSSPSLPFPLPPLTLDAQAPQQPVTPRNRSPSKQSSRAGRSLGNPPGALTWSPDGKHLTYLDGGQLIDLDPGTGKPHVFVSRAKLATLMEGSESERDRDHRARYEMASYIWAPDSAHLLFDSDGRLWVYDLKNGTGVEIGFTGLGSGNDPKFSPDGKTVSFVRDNGLAVICSRSRHAPTVVAPPPTRPSSTARSIGSTKKRWRRAAITSGRPTPAALLICR